MRGEAARPAIALDTRRAEALANADRPPAPPVPTAPKALPPQVVTLNGVVETQKRKKLLLGDKVAYDGKIIVVALA